VLRQGLRAHSVATLCVATECGAACTAGATLPAAAVDRDVVEATGTSSRRDVVEAAGRAAGPAGNRAADASSFKDFQPFTYFIFQRILSIYFIIFQHILPVKIC
jgi:hypothetical protein